MISFRNICELLVLLKVRLDYAIPEKVRVICVCGQTKSACVSLSKQIYAKDESGTDVIVVVWVTFISGI